MGAVPWQVSDELWARIEPVLPAAPRMGRPRLSDRAALQGILFVLITGIPWRALPGELGFGSGVTCWRRLEAWTQAGVWESLHALLLGELRAQDRIDWSRACVDGSHVQAKKGARRRARARSIVGGWDASIT
jgi:transposase